MEVEELIERYFRKELSADESILFNERLATDPAFKRKFEAESLVHKALQFSRERERIRAFAMSPAPLAVAAVQWLDNRALIGVGATAFAVWIFSTFSSSLTGLSPVNIKWVGLSVAIAVSLFLWGWISKTMNLRIGMIGILNGVIIFVTASGIDAINQGVKGFAGKNVQEAYLIPYTENNPWWPTKTLEDSIKGNRKRMLDMGEQIKMLIASRLSSGPGNFGKDPGIMPIVIPRSSTVLSGTTYEADIYIAASASGQTMEVRVDGKSISLEPYAEFVTKGKISFVASADKFDNTGTSKKEFVAEIKVGDSTYRKVVEYKVVKPK